MTVNSETKKKIAYLQTAYSWWSLGFLSKTSAKRYHWISETKNIASEL